MIVAVNTGRKGSKGFPRKNIYNVLGHPLAYYSTKAAYDTEEIDRVYMSTDDEELMKILDVDVIKRPPELCDDKALSSTVFYHALKVIEDRIYPENVELIVLLMANAPCITSNQLSKGIQILRDNHSYDSAVTVSEYNMYSPVRSRLVNNDGLLEPYAPEVLSNTVTSDRNSSRNAWFADMGASIVRPRCLDNMDKGMLPQIWMGQKIYPLKQECGLDVDCEWQIPLVEYWLKTYGGY